jgi:hypothetical protein
VAADSLAGVQRWRLDLIWRKAAGVQFSPRMMLMFVVVLVLAVIAGGTGAGEASPGSGATVTKRAVKKKPRRVCRRGERPQGKRPCIRPPKHFVRPRGRSEQAGPNDVLPIPPGAGIGAGEPFDRGEAAIAWARSFRGQTAYNWRCERFIENAFNETKVFDDAAQAAGALKLHGGLDAPRGTLVFFRPMDWNDNAGHVGISLGHGRMISAFRAVEERAYDSNDTLKASYAGWAEPPKTWRGRLPLGPEPDPHLQPTTDPGTGTGSTPGGSTPAPNTDPSVRITAPADGTTVTGVVTFTAETANVSGVEFDAYYASTPSDVNTLAWHKLGVANSTGPGEWSLPYDTRAIPDQGNPAWTTVNILAVALDPAGNPIKTRTSRRVSVSNPPESVAHYNCTGTPNAIGHYVPGGKYWGDQFVAQGKTITGGYLLMGANVGDHDHSARIGIYSGAGRTGLLGETALQVIGYGGVNFTFPAPIKVSPGQPLWIAATGIGDFTAYDQNNGGADGCFIGRLDGFK